MLAHSLQHPEIGRVGLASVVVLLILLLLPQSMTAQGLQDPVPRISDADNLFQYGVEQFEDGEYTEAHQTFERVYNAFPLNRSTTAAMIMDAKALYRAGAYEQAFDRAEVFMTRYPTSGYMAEAERLAELARQMLDQEQAHVEPLRLGIAMALDEDQSAFTQDLFHGIRLAVEEDNGELDVEALAAELAQEASSSSSGAAFLEGASTTHRQVQMIFQDIGSSSAELHRAVEQLIADDVDVILGPVFSDEAIEAAAVAESHGVPMIAPMATDDRVSEGRTYTFQANPSLSVRGRQMARYAVNDLGMRTIGIAASEGNTLSERMAEGFHEEALRLGAEVPFYQLVADQGGWQEWTDLVDLDSVMVQAEEDGAPLNAVYLPFTGNDAPRLIRMALNDLNRLNTNLQVLGNAEWHNLSDTTPLARHRTVYTNDFHVNDQRPVVQTFNHRYRSLTGNQPGRLAYVGYDVARYVLTLLNEYPDEPLHRVLHRAEPQDGLAMRFDFRDGNANQALFFHRYRYGHIELLD